MAVGAHDPAVAKLVERTGFDVAYVSGSGSATAVNGFTDVGLISFKEMVDHAGNIIAATALPTLCDVDNRQRRRHQRQAHDPASTSSSAPPASTWRTRRSPSAAVKRPGRL